MGRRKLRYCDSRIRTCGMTTPKDVALPLGYVAKISASGCGENCGDKHNSSRYGCAGNRTMLSIIVHSEDDMTVPLSVTPKKPHRAETSCRAINYIFTNITAIIIAVINPQQKHQKLDTTCELRFRL